MWATPLYSIPTFLPQVDLRLLGYLCPAFTDRLAVVLGYLFLYH